MVNLSNNLFLNCFDVHFQGEIIGTIETIRHAELYEAKPKDGTHVQFVSLNLCKNYFQNLCKGRAKQAKDETKIENQLNLF